MAISKFVGWALVAVLGLTGCGSSAGTVGPTGVDELVNPSPSPAVADFGSVTQGVANEWLPLAPGSEWRYASKATSATASITVTKPVRNGGIEALEVRLTVTAAESNWSSNLQVAEDTRGNLWALGQASDGNASLLVPAEPRVGDGWTSIVSGQPVDLTTQVLDRQDGERVTTEVQDVLHSGAPTRVEWVRGTGPVQLVLPEGDVLELTSRP